ncbi:MAG TPA: HAMP domain-containing sensor histidine kinase [Microvirga sp.]|jgi:signal transduction histidine kinase|nr:HAMP domain-containing sensor histidine kinase [Microvirga sp.]
MSTLPSRSAPLIGPGAVAPRMRSASRASLFRSVPIRWRVLSIAIINTVAVLLLGLLVVTYANVLSGAWRSLAQARNTDRVLVAFGTDVERVQGMIHRYLTQPSEVVQAEINRQRQDLLGRLESIKASEASRAVDITEISITMLRLFTGFESLRTNRALVVRIYEEEVLKPAREMAGLYAILTTSTSSSSLLWPAMNRSRDAFSNALVAANSFYLSQTTRAAADAREHIAIVDRTAPVMVGLADNDLQRDALRAIQVRAVAFMTGFNRLAATFSTQTELLQSAVDDNQIALARIIDRLSASVRTAEEQAQARFEQALDDVYTRIGILGLAFMALSILISLATAQSISAPLEQLKETMHDITIGHYHGHVPGVEARDQIGDMARAVRVFQDNTIARHEAEEELRRAKERAEATLLELREAQKNLIEAEKFAALGSLVAGVAHEVNGPVGISLTVASSLAHRCSMIENAIASGPLLRSTFTEFVGGTREAANQLVANLQRAGELVESFKQVAVDRSKVDRRSFDLARTTQQIVVSLLPGTRKRQIAVEVEMPDGLRLDSYPGLYGQVLTNLFLNSITHAFEEGEGGTIRLRASLLGTGQAEIIFEDDGKGMSAETRRRAFEPFFTTRRNEGGTGLGLHIVYNLVTHRLGGRISVESGVGAGTRFRLVLPLTAPRETLAEVEAGRA